MKTYVFKYYILEEQPKTIQYRKQVDNTHNNAAALWQKLFSLSLNQKTKFGQPIWRNH